MKTFFYLIVILMDAKVAIIFYFDKKNGLFL